jgi:TatD DNase family protein
MVDSHCHLAGEEFAAGLTDVVARTRAAGVSEALCILAAGDEAESERARRVRDAWPAVRFAAGIHPHQAGEFSGRSDEAIAIVRQAMDRHGACAVGEIGLDYHYDFSPRDVQQDIFRAQVAFAAARGVPIIIHTREATDDTFRILRDAQGPLVRGVFHCFTGDESMARTALELDFYLSFAGILTFPRAEEIRRAASLTPADRILVETDAPYLAPVPHRGTRNEPAYVHQVAAKLADVRGMAVLDLAEQLRQNFATLFGSRAEATQL